MRSNKGITLVALVITVLILMILVGVSAGFITDEDKSALGAANNLVNSTNEILGKYDNEILEITNEINSSSTNFKLTDTNYNDPSGANEPAYISGLSPVIFNSDGTTVVVSKKSDWYNYEQKQWANAKSADDSLWVWIPRFAYKITYVNSGNKSQGGSIDIVFLKGTSNNYNKNGVLTDAVTDGYIVHPSFQAAKSGDYTNGEWDKNLTGYWVAKFEAGFQQGDAVNTSNNDISKVVRSSVNYTSGAVRLSSIQNGGTEGYNTARNYIDGIYGENISGILEDLDSYNLKETKISYPVFKGANYTMNYISISDSYSLCKALTDDGNIYGFNSKSADSHLMKNSEWGAIAYLSYSKFGTDGQRVYTNNVNLNNSVNSIYAVTGYAGSEVGANPVNTLTGANIWYTQNGQKASSNYNITGIYDLSGGAWERVSSFVSNESTERFGYNVKRDTLNNNNELVSTKFANIYKIGVSDEREANYVANSDKIGDATVETSSTGTGSTGWNSATSVFPSEELPFFIRGGSYNFTSNTGLFSYGRTPGFGLYDSSFRAVICSTVISATGGQSNV